MSKTMDDSCGQLWPGTIQVQAPCEPLCVITVRSSVVIIHDIQLPHKLHIQARLQISGSKRADVQCILGLLLVKYCRRGRKRKENGEKRPRRWLETNRNSGTLLDGEWK